MSNNIRSKLITGISASDSTNQQVAFENNKKLQPGQKINYTVLVTTLDKKQYYCCLAGGVMEDSGVKLTRVGKAAVEVLMALPVGDSERLVMQELKLGPTPLKKKVKKVLRKLPPESKICFFGDMSGELDGHIHKALNFSGQVEISDLVLAKILDNDLVLVPSP